MCIDYTDLNKHCLKDPFPLPHIDQVVDSTAGSVLLCFLDCYSRYHRIALHPDDELGEFDIKFCPRQAIKSQILADFVSEWTEIKMPLPTSGLNTG
jgi:hypothetical protein